MKDPSGRPPAAPSGAALASPSAPAAPVTERCKRCRKPIGPDEYRDFFLRTGLCFWCAYVDPQG